MTSFGKVKKKVFVKKDLIHELRPLNSLACETSTAPRASEASCKLDINTAKLSQAQFSYTNPTIDISKKVQKPLQIISVFCVYFVY